MEEGAKIYQAICPLGLKGFLKTGASRVILAIVFIHTVIVINFVFILWL